MWWMKELQSTIEASINAASGDVAATSEADDDVSCADISRKSFEKYAPVITQFKVDVI